MKIFVLIISFLVSYRLTSDIEIEIFNRLPEQAFTLKCDGRELDWHFLYNVKEVVKDSITFYAEKGFLLDSSFRRRLKLTKDGESQLIVFADNSETNAGIIKWTTESNDFTFSDTTTITTSFKEEYIKLLFPSFRGKIILSQVTEINFIEELTPLIDFMGFKFIRDISKENL